MHTLCTSHAARELWTWLLDPSKSFPVGLHYYAGVVEDAEELIEKHKVATQCFFGSQLAPVESMKILAPVKTGA